MLDGLRSRWRRFWLWVLLGVFFLGGLSSTWTQNPESTPNLRPVLETLRENSIEIETRSVVQERLIESLQGEIESLQTFSREQQNDNERLTTLLDEQRETLSTQGTALDQSLTSQDAMSKSWTSYLNLSESELERVWKVATRRKLLLRWGLPLASIGGFGLGLYLGGMFL